MDKMLLHELMFRDICKPTHLIYFTIRISNGLLIDCNQRFAESLGYEDVRSCMAGYTPLDCRIDKGTKVQLLYDLSRAGEADNITACFYRRDKRICWIDITAIRYSETDIVECIGYDITEKRLAIETLVESEKKFRKLVENLPVGICLVTPDNKVAYFNPAAIKIHGYNTEDIPDTHTWFIRAFPDETYRMEAIRTWDSCFTGNKFNPADLVKNIVVRCKNGEDKVLGFHGVKLENGELVISIIDITDKKQAENALLQYSVARLSNECLDLDEIIKGTLERTKSSLNADVIVFTAANHPFKKTFSCKQNSHACNSFIETAVMAFTPKIKENSRFLILHPNELRQQFPGKDHGMGDLSYAGFPVQVGNNFYGILHIFTSSQFFFNENTVNLILSVCDQLGLSFENDRLRAQNLLAAVMNERHRVARDLHDSVNQNLYSLSLLSEAASRECERRKCEKTKKYLSEIRKISQLVLKEMRIMIDELRPFALKENDFIRAVQSELKSIEIRENITTRFKADVVGILPQDYKNELFRIFQEAVNNILRHASASEIAVFLEEDDTSVYFEIRDNGKGFDSREIKQGMGITNMRERAEKCNGVLSILSTKGIGTRIIVAFDHRQNLKPMRI